MLAERCIFGRNEHLDTDVVSYVAVAVRVVPEVVAVLITINNINGKFTKSKMEEKKFAMCT